MYNFFLFILPIFFSKAYFVQYFTITYTAFTLSNAVQCHKQKDDTYKPFIRSYCESFLIDHHRCPFTDLTNTLPFLLLTLLLFFGRV